MTVPQSCLLWPWQFWRVMVSYFIYCPIIWVYLLFPIIRLNFYIIGKDIRKVMRPSQCITSGYIIVVYITHEVNLDHLVNGVSSRTLRCNVIFSFCNYIFGEGDALRLQISSFCLNFNSPVLASLSRSWVKQLLLSCSDGDVLFLSYFLHLFTGILL